LPPPARGRRIAADPSRPGRGFRVPVVARDLRPQSGVCRAYAVPGRGTSSQTCRPRSGQRAAACSPQRGAAADREDSLKAHPSGSANATTDGCSRTKSAGAGALRHPGPRSRRTADCGSRRIWLRFRGRVGAPQRETYRGCAGLAGDGDFGCVELQYSPGDGEPEAGSRGIAAALLAAVEAVEYARQVFRLDATAGVSDLHADVLPFGNDFHRDLAARRRVVKRILDEIAEHALDQADVAHDQRRLGRMIGRERHLLVGRRQTEFLRDVLHQVVQYEWLAQYAGLFGIEFRELEELPYQPVQPLALPQRNLQIAALLVGRQPVALQLQGLEVPLQRRQRRSEIVRNVG